MLNAESISIICLLLSCLEYHHTTVQAHLLNLDNNTELNSQANSKVTWVGNTKGLETPTEPKVETKHKRTPYQRNVSSIIYSKDQSSNEDGTNLQYLTSTVKYFKNKSDSSQKLSEANKKEKQLRPSIDKNRESIPVYVITGVKVTETYESHSPKAQHNRKNRFLFDTVNSSISTFPTKQRNLTDNNLSAISKYSSVSDVSNDENTTDYAKNFRNIIKNHQIGKHDISKWNFNHVTTTKVSSSEEKYLYSKTESKSDIFVDTSQEVTSAITILGYGTNKNKSIQYHSSNGASNIHEIPNSVIVIELEPVSVSYSSKCDRLMLNSTTCWFERDIGDTVTLAINISSLKEDNSVNVRWIKTYKKRNRKTGFVVKIDPGRLPWNMVWQDGGRELRLNPVTNSDVDPNGIAARVCQATSNSEQGRLYHKIRQLDFRIDVRSIDVIEVYPGKDIIINLDDFLTLPKSRRFWMDWKLEKFPGQHDPLPWNFKVSPNQRSLVIKHSEDRQLGVVTCVAYSSKGLAFAKRKFNIHKMAERPTLRSKKRSLSKHHRKLMAMRRRNPFLRCLGRGDTTNAMSEYMKPISRKKRFKRMKKFLESQPYKRDCRSKNKNRRRLHPRWVPLPLFDDYEDEESTTTLDPRVKSVRELIELSESSDGTIDDVIMHEVHYVEPEMTLVSDKFLSFPKSPDFQPNCTTDEDCGQGALCVVPQGQRRRNATREAKKNHHRGYCYCRPEYYGDGFQCTKIPSGLHREKRIRRKRDVFFHVHHFSSSATSLVLPVRESKGNRSKRQLP